MMKSFVTLFITALILTASVGIASGKAYNESNSKFNYNLVMEELPADFPQITVNSIDNPAPGFIFMENLSVGGLISTYIMVLDNQGKPVYYYKPFLAGIDFKMLPNGLFSYCVPVKIGDEVPIGPLKVQNVMVQHQVLDANYNKIDDVQMKNGYLADFHEFVMLPNGNYLMNAYEYMDVDMSKIVPQGNPNAIVVGTVLQELDKNKNCVFQWRSLDHFPVTESQDNLENNVIVHMHGNSIFPDNDGNIIVSFPAAFEIIKINTTTGEPMWRFGGPKSDFAITGDHEEFKPNYFSMQHNAIRLPNGNLMFYDNGAAKDPAYSRAVEYSIDEQNKKANLVWEYRHDPDISAFAMGSVQRLKNGNTLINWGLITGDEYRTMTEVTPDKRTTFELSLPSNSYSYRAFKYDLPACQPVADVSKTGIAQGNSYEFTEVANNTGVGILFTSIGSSGSPSANVKKFECSPVNPAFAFEAPILLPGRYEVTAQNINTFQGEMWFNTTELPRNDNTGQLKIYFRTIPGSGQFTELNTTYNSTDGKLSAQVSSFGEYVIGFPRQADKILAPKLMFPDDMKYLQNGKTATLQWSPTGRYDKFQVQVAEDAGFNNIIRDSLNLTVTKWQTLNYTNNKTYYWRARTFYRDLVSDWSDTRQFTFADKFIGLEFPNGGEILGKDTLGYVIRWKTNLADSVSITLINNSVKEAVIKDTIGSTTHAFFWRVPANIPEGKNYKIQVRSTKDSKIVGESAANFEIRNKITDVVEQPIEVNNSDVIRVLPNPSTGNSLINLKLNKSGYVNLKITDQLGNEIQTLVNTFMSEGIYNLKYDASSLSSGVYYLVLRSGNSVITKKIVIIR
jgi:hypothetical protein